jgi:hypothetical protein
MSTKNKDEYLSNMRLVLERVREAAKASQTLGTDSEFFINTFLTITVG